MIDQYPFLNYKSTIFFISIIHSQPSQGTATSFRCAECRSSGAGCCGAGETSRRW